MSLPDARAENGSPTQADRRPAVAQQLTKLVAPEVESAVRGKGFFDLPAGTTVGLHVGIRGRNGNLEYRFAGVIPLVESVQVTIGESGPTHFSFDLSSGTRRKKGEELVGADEDEKDSRRAEVAEVERALARAFFKDKVVLLRARGIPPERVVSLKLRTRAGLGS